VAEKLLGLQGSGHGGDEHMHGADDDSQLPHVISADVHRSATQQET